MGNSNDFDMRLKQKIAEKYPQRYDDEIPLICEKKIVNYKKDEIDNYEIIVWHRVLRSIYGEPSEVECTLGLPNSEAPQKNKSIFLRKTLVANRRTIIPSNESLALDLESGDAQPVPVNWRYFITLPSGGIIELGTKDRVTIFCISRIYLEKNESDHGKEIRTFINDLLRELNRVKDQIFNPVKEFENERNLNMYLIFNVFLLNYESANKMAKISNTEEELIRQECLKFDARNYDLSKDENEHIEKYMVLSGMFYSSAISYYFIALEGFVNILYHSFLKNCFRDKSFQTAKRLDLEQKIRFLPALCDGFDDETYDINNYIDDFKKLKRYRNALFHANIEDSLKDLNFFENGFFYGYSIDDSKNNLLSYIKCKLNIQDVINVKKIIDKILDEIIYSMNEETRKITEKTILKKRILSFKKTNNGLEIY